MAKIKIEDIRKAAIEQNWKLISDTYKNLKSPLEFKCNEGHSITIPYDKVRNKWECPICMKNKYYNFETKIIPKKKDTQRVIGLDQATHITGYSIFDGNDLIYAGVFEATLDTEIGRDVEVKNWLIQLIYNWKPDIIGIEGIQLQKRDDKLLNVTTYQTLARLQGILMATCHEHDIDYYVIPPATWRAHCKVTGRNRTDRKKSMQMRVKERFDITVSDDVADAIGIGLYVSQNYKRKVKVFSWEE